MIDSFDSKAFDLAADSAKRFISLSVAILGFSAAFFKTLIDRRAPWLVRMLGTGWFLYLLSSFSGMGFLLALTGVLDVPADAKSVPSIWEPLPGA